MSGCCLVYLESFLPQKVSYKLHPDFHFLPSTVSNHHTEASHHFNVCSF